MNGTWLNGRKPEDWELAAIARARQCALERDMTQLAGVLASGDKPWQPPPPATADLDTGDLL